MDDMSNNRTVLASIPESERAKEVKDLDLEHDVSHDERVLGVNWCTTAWGDRGSGGRAGRPMFGRSAVRSLPG